jgi:hypothetical protein
MSFSGFGYHDHEQRMERTHLDNRLTTIEENQQEIQSMLHQHTQWQAEAGERLTTIRNTRSRRTRIGDICSMVSTSTRLSERP